MFSYNGKWISHFSDCTQPLIKTKHFPLDTGIFKTFRILKPLLMKAALQCPKTKPCVRECNASEVAISATLNQSG